MHSASVSNNVDLSAEGIQRGTSQWCDRTLVRCWPPVSTVSAGRRAGCRSQTARGRCSGDARSP